MGHFEEMKDLYGVPFIGRTGVAESFTDVYGENTATSSEPQTPSGYENP